MGISHRILDLKSRHVKTQKPSFCSGKNTLTQLGVLREGMVDPYLGASRSPSDMTQRESIHELGHGEDTVLCGEDV